MKSKELYIVKFKGETVDNALKKCGGLKQCFKTLEESLDMVKHAKFNIKELNIIKITYEKINIT